MLIKVRLCGSAWHGSQRCVDCENLYVISHFLTSHILYIIVLSFFFFVKYKPRLVAFYGGSILAQR